MTTNTRFRLGQIHIDLLKNIVLAAARDGHAWPKYETLGARSHQALDRLIGNGYVLPVPMTEEEFAVDGQLRHRLTLKGLAAVQEFAREVYRGKLRHERAAALYNGETKGEHETRMQAWAQAETELTRQRTHATELSNALYEMRKTKFEVETAKVDRPILWSEFKTLLNEYAEVAYLEFEAAQRVADCKREDAELWAEAQELAAQTVTVNDSDLAKLCDVPLFNEAELQAMGEQAAQVELAGDAVETAGEQSIDAVPEAAAWDGIK